MLESTGDLLVSNNATVGGTLTCSTVGAAAGQSSVTFSNRVVAPILESGGDTVVGNSLTAGGSITAGANLTTVGGVNVTGGAGEMAPERS